MKRTNVFLSAIALLAMVAISCEWFGKAKPDSTNFLVGKWYIDSLHTDKDSGNAALAVLLFAVAQKDSSKISLQFTKDSILTLESDSVLERQRYILDTARLEIRSLDSTSQVYTYQQQNDSILVLRSKDSVSLHLRKQ